MGRGGRRCQPIQQFSVSEWRHRVAIERGGEGGGLATATGDEKGFCRRTEEDGYELPADRLLFSFLLLLLYVC